MKTELDTTKQGSASTGRVVDFSVSVGSGAGLDDVIRANALETKQESAAAAKVMSVSGIRTETGVTTRVTAGSAQSRLAIPTESPLFNIANLEHGWDGFSGEPLPQILLERAQELLDDLSKLDEPSSSKPVAHPGEDSIWLTWRSKTQTLQLRITCDPSFLVESCLTDKSGIKQREEFTSAMNVRRAFRKYLNG